jgi:hypothetical protein
MNNLKEVARDMNLPYFEVSVKDTGAMNVPQAPQASAPSIGSSAMLGERGARKTSQHLHQ